MATRAALFAAAGLYRTRDTATGQAKAMATRHGVKLEPYLSGASFASTDARWLAGAEDEKRPAASHSELGQEETVVAVSCTVYTTTQLSGECMRAKLPGWGV
ncbi:hypothetical protein GUJ93_ZPchr0013g36648 [Zizania palustris]|uniref:Uncharacterized protein n=1 Tax=Zizania palustris TaxID=103762 RepID=A0A8J5WUV6_ZIZPA|nr:hypothetical protein GUJ93_ZPchr0013g36648 [Zizania palustris]